jgi:hypothetical protein
MCARGARWVILLVLILLVSGCGPRFGDVSGTVKFKGKPMAGGTITFYDANKKPYSSTIATDGSYSISKVPYGRAKIAVYQTIDIKFEGGFTAAGGGAMPGREAPKKETAPSKFSDPEQSGLTCDVNSPSQTHEVTID